MLNTVVVGRVGAPHGVRGWVRVQSFTDPAENLFSYSLSLQRAHNDWQEIEIEQVQQHGNGFIAKLRKVDDRDQAALLTNANLVVKREDLPELDEEEHYWTDIMGLEVYNQDKIHLGKAVDFFDIGANEVLVVQGEKGEHLIPYVPEMYITAVDLKEGRLYVRWDTEF